MIKINTITPGSIRQTLERGFETSGVRTLREKLYKKGDRIRLKVPLMFTGWQGCGTITRDQLWPGQTIFFKRDGHRDSDWEACQAKPEEVERIKK